MSGRHPAADYLDEPRTQPRFKDREREALRVAAQAAGLTEDVALRWHAFADGRAAPGGVRANLDGIKEMREEVADCANYGPWELEQLRERIEAGDADALERYARIMGALRYLAAAWALLDCPLSA